MLVKNYIFTLAKKELIVVAKYVLLEQVLMVAEPVTKISILVTTQLQVVEELRTFVLSLVHGTIKNPYYPALLSLAAAVAAEWTVNEEEMAVAYLATLTQVLTVPLEPKLLVGPLVEGLTRA